MKEKIAVVLALAGLASPMIAKDANAEEQESRVDDIKLVDNAKSGDTLKCKINGDNVDNNDITYTWLESDDSENWVETGIAESEYSVSDEKYIKVRIEYNGKNFESNVVRVDNGIIGLSQAGIENKLDNAVVTASYASPMTLARASRLASNVNLYVPDLEVKANSQLRVNIESNIDMDDADVIWQTGFESGENKPNLRWQPFDGNQSFVSENGNTVERLVNNRTNLEGNFFSYPDTKSPNSYSSFQQPITSTNERWFSAVANVKASGGSYNSFAFRGIPGHESGGKQMTDDEGKLVKYKNSASWKNSTPREVEVYSDGGTVKFNDGATYVLVSSTSRNYDWGLSYFIWHQAEQKFVFDPGGGDRYVNKRPATPQAQLNAQVFNAGDPVICYPGNADLYFTERQIQNDNQWHRISQNAKLGESVENYDYSKYGFFPAYYWSTDGEMEIDNIKFGYASRSLIYEYESQEDADLNRNGKLVETDTNKQYQSDFSTTKSIKPNAPTITGEVNNDAVTATFKFKSDDITKPYFYRAKSISNRTGNESRLSVTKKVDVTQHIIGYAVKVDNSPTGDPGTKATQNTDTITVNKSQVNVKLPIYAHIRAIGANGEVSDVTNSTPIEIVDKSIANSYVPELNAFQQGVHPKVEINIDMDEHDVVGKIDFSNPSQYNLNARNTGTGNQTIQHNGNKYYYNLTDTITNKNGNDHDPADIIPVTYSRVMYPNSVYKPKNGQWLSFSYSVKNKGYGWINSITETEKQTYKTEDKMDSSGCRLLFNQDVNFSTVPESINVEYEGGKCDLCDDHTFVVCTKSQGPYTEILYRLDKENKKLVWAGWWHSAVPKGQYQTFHRGDAIQTRHWAEGSAVRYFNGESDWHKVSNNYIATDSTDYYDMSKDGVHFFQSNGTAGELSMADLKFGYASAVKLYRDGKLINDGTYESDFVDNDITITPNKVDYDKVEATVNDDDVNFGVSAKNKSEKHEYQAQSISNYNGRISTISPITQLATVNMEANVDHYNAWIDNSPTANQSKLVNAGKGVGDENAKTLSTKNASITDPDLDVTSPIYLHVQVVDQNGQTSEITTKEAPQTASQLMKEIEKAETDESKAANARLVRIPDVISYRELKNDGDGMLKYENAMNDAGNANVKTNAGLKDVEVSIDTEATEFTADPNSTVTISYGGKREKKGDAKHTNLFTSLMALGGVKADETSNVKVKEITLNRTVSPSISAQTLNEAKLVTDKYLASYNPSAKVLNSNKTDAEKIEAFKEDITNSLNQVLNVKGVQENGKYTYTIDDLNFTAPTDKSKGNLSFSINITDGTETVTSEYAVKILDQLPQTLDTVKNLYTEATNKFVPSNDTTEDDLLSLVQITNVDISAEVSEFKLVPSVDTREGRLTAIVKLKDSETGETASVPVAVDVPIASTELATAVKNVQAYRNSLTMTNDTQTLDIIRGAQSSIHNSNILVSWSVDGDEAVKRKDATEDDEGYFKGCLIVSDSENEVKVPFSYTITKLPQTVNSAMEKAEKALKNNSYVDTTTESDVFNIVLNTLHDYNIADLDIKITDFGVEAATEESEGNLKGILNITKGDESATFDLSELKIKQAAQTYATLEKALKGTQNKIHTNSTSKSEVQEMLNSYVTGAEGSIFKITIDDDDFKVTKATEDSAGKINVVATVTDNNADIHKINLQYKINQLPQTVDGAYEKALEIWNNYNNKTATIDKDDLTEKLQAAITHIEGSDITITVNDFEVTPPTELAEGSIEGSINISDSDKNSKTILINEELNRLAITDETIKTQIEEALKKIKPTNDSTKENIIEQIFTESGLPEDTVTIDIKDFKVSKSTGRVEGKVTGTIVANDNSIPLDLIIDKVTQDNDTTKVALDSYIEEYQEYIIEHNTVSMDDIANSKELDTVDVTEESSLNYLIDKINNANADLKWKECDVTSPTETKEGKLEGILVLTDTASGNEIQKYNVKITIPKAPPVLKYSEKVFKDELGKSNFTNKTSESDIAQILDKLPEDVKTNLSKFSITKATSKKAGSIRFTVSYEHDNERDKLNYTISIPKVGSHDTSDILVSDVTQAEKEAKSGFQEVVDKINKLLDEHKYTSDSDWNTIDSIVKENLNEGYKYKIVKYDRTGSTIESSGKIDYTISISDKQFVATTEHTITLPKLNSTEESSSTSQSATITPIDEVKDTDVTITSNLKDIFNSLDAKLKNYSYNKNTSTKDILNTMIKTIGNKCNYTLDAFDKKVDESKQTIINFKTSLWDKVSKISSTYNVTIPESGETHVDSNVDKIEPTPSDVGISNKDNGFAKGELDVTKAEDKVNKQIEKDKPDSCDKIVNSIEKSLPAGFSYDILNYKKVDPTETTEGSIEYDLKIWNEYTTSTTHYKIIIPKLGSHTPIEISHDETGMNGGAPTIKGESQKIYNMHKKIKDDINKSNISNSTQYADIENIIKADVTEGYNYTISDYRLVADKNIDFNLKIGNDTTAVTMHYTVNIKDKSCTIDMISIDNDNTKYGESDISNIPKNPEKPTNSGSSGSHSSGGHSSGGHSSGGHSTNSSSDDSEDDSDIGSSGYSHSNSDIGDSSSSNSDEDKDNNNSLDDDSVDYANDVEEDDILTITSNNSKRNINVNKDTTSDNVNAIKIITKDYKWNEDKSNSGTVSLLYDENKSLEGVRLKTSNAYASGNKVTIDTGTKNVNKITGLYYYNKEVGAYVDTGEAISYNGTKVTFSTTGETMYLLARDNTNINIVKNGWIKTNGKYQYIENSKLVKNTWKQINNKWYRFDNKGFMMTGWQGQDGYIKDTGELATGWTPINGKWYYFEDSGKPKQGWVSTNGKWYYMNTAGEMQTGWVQDQGTWYYMNSDGSMATGWIETGGNWYYLDQSGHMLYNTTVDGYVLDGSGKWIQ